MLAKFFLLFTLIPLLELFLLIKIGNHIGALNAILLVLGAGISGAFLASAQGVRTFHRIQLNLSQGIMPGEEIIDGLLIFVAGVLLITPGLLTDVAALFLLIPYTRNIVKRMLRRKFDRMAAAGGSGIFLGGGRRGGF